MFATNWNVAFFAFFDNVHEFCHFEQANAF